jgi:hypothetical protein
VNHFSNQTVIALASTPANRFLRVSQKYAPSAAALPNRRSKIVVSASAPKPS